MLKLLTCVLTLAIASFAQTSGTYGLACRGVHQKVFGVPKACSSHLCPAIQIHCYVPVENNPRPDGVLFLVGIRGTVYSIARCVAYVNPRITHAFGSNVINYDPKIKSYWVSIGIGYPDIRMIGFRFEYQWAFFKGTDLVLSNAAYVIPGPPS